jgi:DNA-binding transcriptional LysR family regulator
VTDLNDVLVFTRVVEQGSFTGGAKLLGMPKSSVSRSIARLEERLNARLIQRSTRRINLTEVGRRYYEQCRRIIQELEAANAMVEGFQSAPVGTLRISAPIILGQAFLGLIVSDYLHRYSGTRCFVELSNRAVDLIEEGFDLAIRVGTLPDSSLRQQWLGQTTTALYASSTYLKQQGVPRLPNDLLKHSLLDFGASDRESKWRLQKGERAIEIEVTAKLFSNDIVVLREAALRGHGITRLPIFSAHQEVIAGNLKPILPDWQTPKVDITAVYPSHKSLSPSVRAFIDLVADSFQQMR